MVLVAFDQQQVAGRDALDLLFERRLALAAQLVHDAPSAASDTTMTSLQPACAVPVGVLAGLVDVEAVVRVLDHRHPQAALHEARDELLDQRGLAAAGPSGETEDLHARRLYQCVIPRSDMAIGDGVTARTASRHLCRAGDLPVPALTARTPRIARRPDARSLHRRQAVAGGAHRQRIPNLHHAQAGISLSAPASAFACSTSMKRCGLARSSTSAARRRCARRRRRGRRSADQPARTSASALRVPRQPPD